MAFVTLRDPALRHENWADKIQRQVSEQIGMIARPSRVYILDAMPKTRSGKIVRRLLKEIVTSGHVQGDVSGMENPEIVESLMEQLRPGDVQE